MTWSEIARTPAIPSGGRAETETRPKLPAKRQSDAEHWRTALRPKLLRGLLADTATLKWTPRLFAALMEELCVDDTFVELVGDLIKRDLP